MADGPTTASTLDEPLPHQLPAQRGRYSLSRAIRCLAERSNTRRHLDGLEGEVSREIGLRQKGPPEPHAFYLPWDAQVRSLSTVTGAGGIRTLVSRDLIDVLRAKLVVAALGARVLPGLAPGKAAIPRRTATVALGWLAEGASPGSSSPAIAQQVLLEPRIVGAYVDVSRTAVSSIPHLEDTVVDDLLAAIAVEVDRVALCGTGADNQPLGLLNAGVPTQTLGASGAAPTRAALVAMEKALADANADAGSLGFATTPAVRAKLRQTERATGCGRFVWDDDGTLLGYPAVASNQLPSNLAKGSGANLSPILFGNWADLVVGLWGAARVIVDPFTGGVAGSVRISALQGADVGIRHPESFVAIKDAATA